MLKVAVVGSRSIIDYDWVRAHLNAFHAAQGDFTVVSGGASGVDSIASIWARDHGLPSEVYFPQYQLYGQRAPLERNHEIVEAADLVLAFWDGQSTGTMHTVGLARKAGKEVVLLEPSAPPSLARGQARRERLDGTEQDAVAAEDGGDDGRGAGESSS